MKKSIAFLTVALALALVIGCGSAPAPTPEQAPPGLPSFYLNPPQADDAIYGVGSAKMSTLDTSRRMAVSRAREDIAFQMNAAIQAAIVDYAQEAGMDGNVQVISFVETISRQVTETTLQGARTDQVEQGPDGTIYALVSYPLSGFAQAAGEAFRRNEDAAFAEFKADQALQALDAQLQNNPPAAGSQR
ncbi:hypothetical protein AU468_07485 [Alkalispirochaeta sphaeroplastigenens]|uniref:Lipoprotein n=1 Tax=Alkalispirochaeta sphaeroplastigenens TaxID=1187066 RepID=A0A2S4JQH6_9SPIO|nr:LPP20 family lipoprotein [Alkalispirochaeta sphaeroplastigenens]POR01789.1 hypothetical protein AU468_07485 [Alkalispirochaeta sphaeroplastigenens]